MTAETAQDGWLVIDKPQGMTSSRVVAIVRRHTGMKAGHAGTLDPIATGVLPIALGEATKTVAYAMSGWKRYRFTIRWGIERDSGDSDGTVVAETAARPGRAEIEGILPRFTGTILQRPPAFSALKIGGRRAYALARAAQPPLLSPRPVEIAELTLDAIGDEDHAMFSALVGKGTYIRALARDIAAALGTLGHITELRRLSVGPFLESQAISLEFLAECRHNIGGHLLPLETALDDIPALALDGTEALRLRRGQRVTPLDPAERARLQRIDEGTIVSARCGRALIALARIESGGLRPLRVINR
jgi:tRNA pseudouridine55 synthase